MVKLTVDVPKKLFFALEKRAKNSSFYKGWHVTQALKTYLQEDFDIRDALEGLWKNA